MWKLDAVDRAHVADRALEEALLDREELLEVPVDLEQPGQRDWRTALIS